MMGQVILPMQLLPGKTADWNPYLGKKCMKAALAVTQYKMQIIYIKKKKRWAAIISSALMWVVPRQSQIKALILWDAPG